jgi:hypothetical protein
MTAWERQAVQTTVERVFFGDRTTAVLLELLDASPIV